MNLVQIRDQTSTILPAALLDATVRCYGIIPKSFKKPTESNQINNE